MPGVCAVRTGIMPCSRLSAFPVPVNTARNKPDRRLSVAPMMARTDRHERYLLRLITRRTLLYTEMVSSGALVHGDAERLLAFHPAEHPIALQVGVVRTPWRWRNAPGSPRRPTSMR